MVKKPQHHSQIGKDHINSALNRKLSHFSGKRSTFLLTLASKYKHHFLENSSERLSARHVPYPIKWSTSLALWWGFSSWHSSQANTQTWHEDCRQPTIMKVTNNKISYTKSFKNETNDEHQCKYVYWEKAAYRGRLKCPNTIKETTSFYQKQESTLTYRMRAPKLGSRRLKKGPMVQWA